MRNFLLGLAIGVVGIILAGWAFMSLLALGVAQEFGGNEGSGSLAVILAVIGTVLAVFGPLYFWILKPIFGDGGLFDRLIKK